jgi:hypothetical protein
MMNRLPMTASVIAATRNPPSRRTFETHFY